MEHTHMNYLHIEHGFLLFLYVPARPEPTIPHKKQVDQKPSAKNHSPKHPNETEKLAITTIHFGSYLSVKPTYIGVSKR